jgi:hypothetical protein
MTTLREAVIIYQRMELNLQQMGDTLLELCRSPEATPAQVNKARLAFAQVWESFDAVRRELRVKAPHSCGIKPYPWSK